jgi:hypothetical protein
MTALPNCTNCGAAIEPPVAGPRRKRCVYCGHEIHWPDEAPAAPARSLKHSPLLAIIGVTAMGATSGLAFVLFRVTAPAPVVVVTSVQPPIRGAAGGAVFAEVEAARRSALEAVRQAQEEAERAREVARASAKAAEVPRTPSPPVTVASAVSRPKPARAPVVVAREPVAPPVVAFDYEDAKRKLDVAALEAAKACSPKTDIEGKAFVHVQFDFPGTVSKARVEGQTRWTATHKSQEGWEKTAVADCLTAPFRTIRIAPFNTYLPNELTWAVDVNSK